MMMIIIMIKIIIIIIIIINRISTLSGFDNKQNRKMIYTRKTTWLKSKHQCMKCNAKKLMHVTIIKKDIAGVIARVRL